MSATVPPRFPGRLTDLTVPADKVRTRPPLPFGFELQSFPRCRPARCRTNVRTIGDLVSVRMRLGPDMPARIVAFEGGLVRVARREPAASPDAVSDWLVPWDAIR